MPNKRAPGQTLIPFAAKAGFVRALDQGVKKSRYSSRSQFIRDAIHEKLCRIGIEMDEELTDAPDRLGKGGRKKKVEGADPPGVSPKMQDTIRRLKSARTSESQPPEEQPDKPTQQ